MDRKLTHDHPYAPPHREFAKVVYPPAPAPHPLVADGIFRRVRALERPLLHVGQGFEDEADDEEDDADDVGPRSEIRVSGRVRVVGRGGHGRGVEEGDGEGDGPDPEELEDPEPGEAEEMRAHLVEPVVGAGPDDPEEEEAS